MDYQNLKESIEFLDSGQPPAENAGLFGVNPDPLESLVVLMPVRWEGTASYIKGAALGPEAIIQASHQLDLMDIAFGRPYSSGIYLKKIEAEKKTKRCMSTKKMKRGKKGKHLKKGKRKMKKEEAPAPEAEIQEEG